MADLKKHQNAHRSTSGKYMAMVLEKQMSGFHVALGGAVRSVERSAAKPTPKRLSSAAKKTK